MKRALVGVTAVLCIGGTCQPPSGGGQPPNAPDFEVIDFQTSTLQGLFRTPCVDPEGATCRRKLLVVRGTTTVADLTASVAGDVTVTGLAADTTYRLIPYHTDGTTPVYQEPLSWRTKATPGLGAPSVHAVVPGLLQGTTADIVGRGFSDVPVVRLIDPKTGAWTTQQVTRVEPNRVRVSVLGAGFSRRRMFLSVVGGRDVDAASDVVVIASALINPPRSRPRISLVRWVPSAVCYGGAGYIATDGLPAACLCHLRDRWEEGTRLRNFGTSPPPLDPVDSWANEGWSDLHPHVYDAEAELSALCSEARGTGFELADEIVVVRNVVTLASGWNAFPEIGPTSRDVANMARRERGIPCDPWPGGAGKTCALESPPQDYCTTSRAGYQYRNEYRVPDDCGNYRRPDEDEIVVQLVMALYLDNVEIDPATRDGIAEPPNEYADTRGLVIITENRYRGSRPIFITQTYTIPEYGERTSNTCIAHWRDPNGEFRKTNWRRKRPLEDVPNDLAHYLLYPLVGLEAWAHAPCLTAAREASSASCPRGFRMDFGRGFTAAQECQRAVDGHGGRDYTTYGLY